MKTVIKILSLAIIGIFTFWPSLAFSDVPQTSSSNYQLSEVFFGSGGQLNACSANFCSKQSAGELAAGNTKSANYQAQAGFNTNREPYIQMITSNTTTNLGTLNADTSATATANFSVETYLAHGYTVVNGSDPPMNGSYTMQALSTPTASSVGSEQFGINLVANTSPTTFGANPSYTPSSGSFSHGIVDINYDTANLYMYSKGSTIALSTQSTSFTNYTISYLFNISHTTPGGSYIFNHVLIATSTY
ncbi:MAG TPA: hypothetical protein VIH90_05330 [Candidatus Saccharimonadales bacterium]